MQIMCYCFSINLRVSVSMDSLFINLILAEIILSMHFFLISSQQKLDNYFSYT